MYDLRKDSLAFVYFEPAISSLFSFLPFLQVLGVGTLWDDNGLVEGDAYVGENGLTAWREDIGCSGDLPVEGSHWNEACISLEFMTPFFGFNRPAIVSTLTMGTLEDLGYEVNRQEQDKFGIDDLGECGRWCPEANRRLNELGNARGSAGRRLSAEGELSIRRAASIHFKRKPTEIKQNTEHRRPSENVISAIFEENGKFFSRIIQRGETGALDS